MENNIKDFIENIKNKNVELSYDLTEENKEFFIKILDEIYDVENPFYFGDYYTHIEQINCQNFSGNDHVILFEYCEYDDVIHFSIERR